MIDTSVITSLIASNDAAGLATYLKENELQITNGKITATSDQVKAAAEYWDKQQHVRKINLNSLYGALLNKGCRFNDQRIGQSTTLTGRCIAKHMASTVNSTVTGVADHIGQSIIYGDTDSVYFSVWPLIEKDVESGEMPWSKDDCIQLYDSIADTVNASFPQFMHTAFNCSLENGSIIRGGRELIASSGLFIKKKRYAAVIYDLEGKRLDQMPEEEALKKKVIPGIGKIKAMGLDLKRSDTPPVVQTFLSEVLLDTLTHVSLDKIIERIITFKRWFTALHPWEKGTPKRVNNLTKYTALFASGKYSMIPGHVMAAINWNKLREIHGDKHSPMIVDGMKTIVCKLKPNPMRFTSVGYPTDTEHIPTWFKELPFDGDLMEATIIDKKLENLLGAMKWNIVQRTNITTTFGSMFTIDE